MAFIVARPNGAWELRRSRSTPAGPRSETLISFRELTEEVSRRAIDRSDGSITAEELRTAARRAGAPVAPDPARAATAGLIGELSRGAELPARWRRALVDLLTGARPVSPDATTLAEWGEASASDRGEALHDLLLLADAVPRRRAPGPLTYPRLATGRR